MKLRLGILLAGAALLAAAPAFASSITYNFNPSNLNQAIGSPASFTVDGITVTASGYVGANFNSLYEKSAGAGETGLGLSGTVNDEINPGQSIVIDVSGLIIAGYSSGTFTLGSLQSGEEATISVNGGNTYAGLIASSDTGSQLVNWGNNSLITFTTYGSQPDPSGNYLISSLDVPTTVTPEPSTLVLMGTALLGLFGLAMRRRTGWLG